MGTLENTQVSGASVWKVSKKTGKSRFCADFDCESCSLTLFFSKVKIDILAVPPVCRLGWGCSQLRCRFKIRAPSMSSSGRSGRFCFPLELRKRLWLEGRVLSRQEGQRRVPPSSRTCCPRTCSVPCRGPGSARFEKNHVRVAFEGSLTVTPARKRMAGCRGWRRVALRACRVVAGVWPGAGVQRARLAVLPVVCSLFPERRCFCTLVRSRASDAGCASGVQRF